MFTRALEDFLQWFHDDGFIIFAYKLKDHQKYAKELKRIKKLKIEEAIQKKAKKAIKADLLAQKAISIAAIAEEKRKQDQIYKEDGSDEEKILHQKKLAKKALKKRRSLLLGQNIQEVNANDDSNGSSSSGDEALNLEYFSRYNRTGTKGKKADLEVPVMGKGNEPGDLAEDHTAHWEGKGFRNNLIDIFEKLKKIDNNEYRAGESEGSYETDNENMEDEFIDFENFNVQPGKGKSSGLKKTGRSVKGENSVGNSLESSAVVGKSLHLVVPEMNHKSGSGSLDSSVANSSKDNSQLGYNGDEVKALEKVNYDANVTISEEHTEDCLSSERVSAGISRKLKEKKREVLAKKAKGSVLKEITEEKPKSVVAMGEGHGLVISAKKRMVPKRRLVSEYSKKFGKSVEPEEEG
jgi:hypothetical protein